MISENDYTLYSIHMYIRISRNIMHTDYTEFLQIQISNKTVHWV